MQPFCQDFEKQIFGIGLKENDLEESIDRGDENLISSKKFKRVNP